MFENLWEKWSPDDPAIRRTAEAEDGMARQQRPQSADQSPEPAPARAVAAPLVVVDREARIAELVASVRAGNLRDIAELRRLLGD